MAYRLPLTIECRKDSETVPANENKRCKIGYDSPETLLVNDTMILILHNISHREDLIAVAPTDVAPQLKPTHHAQILMCKNHPRSSIIS